MMKILAVIVRHVLAVAALPFMVTIVVPVWVAGRYDVPVIAPSSLPGFVAAFAGIVSLAAGLALFAASFYNFATQGLGTLAPWDPPRRLVVRGPYRYVRNPMISGVVFILVAEGLMLRSVPHLAWASLFMLINAVYIPFAEEPQLADRFGEDYARYKRHVPRIIPRLTPWDGIDTQGDR
jgi:protein-S-isoprenylcysteine O-methyltransferase Ste14